MVFRGPTPLRRRLRGLLGAVVLSSALGGGAAGVAEADVDPASDVLLLQDFFVPYQPQVCSEVKGALGEATKRSRAAGYPLKLALIASPSDLGGVPQFFGNPNPYAKFLGHELELAGHGVSRPVRILPVVVVMPQGFGLYHTDPRVAKAVSSVEVPNRGDPTALAGAALRALPKITAAAGHPIAAVAIPTRCSQSSGSAALFLAPLAVLLVAGLVYAFGFRGRGRRDEEADLLDGSVAGRLHRGP
jgi:hypothetical protein